MSKYQVDAFSSGNKQNLTRSADIAQQTKKRQEELSRPVSYSDAKRRKTARNAQTIKTINSHLRQAGLQQISANDRRFSNEPDFSTITFNNKGKQYTLSRAEFDGVKQLYRQTWDSHYGQDDEDQLNKRNGVMPRSYANGYKRGDESLYELGLPSSKYLGKYLDAYRSAIEEQKQLEADYKRKNTRLNDFYNAVGRAWMQDEVERGTYTPNYVFQSKDEQGNVLSEDTWDARRQKQFFELLEQPQWADVRAMYAAGKKSAKAASEYATPREYYEAMYKAELQNKEFTAEQQAKNVYDVSFSYDDFDRMYSDKLRGFYLKQNFVDGIDFTGEDAVNLANNRNEVAKVSGDVKGYVDSYQGDYLDMLKNLMAGGASRELTDSVKEAVVDKMKKEYKGVKGKEFYDSLSSFTNGYRALLEPQEQPRISKETGEELLPVKDWVEEHVGAVAKNADSYKDVFNRMRQEGYTDDEVKEARKYMLRNQKYAWNRSGVNEEYYQNFNGGIQKYARKIANGYDIDGKTSPEVLSNGQTPMQYITQLANAGKLTPDTLQDAIGYLRKENISASVVKSVVNQYITGAERGGMLTATDGQNLRETLQAFADSYENDERGAIIEIARDRLLANGYKNFDVDQAFSAVGWQDAIPIEVRAMDYFISYGHAQDVMSGEDKTEALRYYQMSEDDRENQSMEDWFAMSEEERNAYIERFDLEKDFNPVLNKSYEQQIHQQFVGAWAKVAVGLLTSAANVADMASQWNQALVRRASAEFVSQMDNEEYDEIIAKRQASIDELRKTNAAIQMYGKAQGQDGISNLISIGSDVFSEILRMQTMNFIGGGVADGILNAAGVSGGMAAVAAGEANISRGFARLCKIASSVPFITDATANYWGEAMQEEGVSVGDATAYALVCGLLEGAVESINANNIFNRALGGGKLADKLLRSGRMALTSDFTTKCKIIGLVSNALGEGAEEGISYLASLILGNFTIRKNQFDTRPENLKQGWERAWSGFSWGEFGSEIGMGALVGLVADGIAGGADQYSPQALIIEEMERRGITMTNAQILNGLEVLSSLDAHSLQDYTSHMKPEDLLSDKALQEQMEKRITTAQQIEAMQAQYDATVKNHEATIARETRNVRSYTTQRENALKSGNLKKIEQITNVLQNHKNALAKAESDLKNNQAKWQDTLRNQINPLQSQYLVADDAITRHWVAYTSAMDTYMEAMSNRKRMSDRQTALVDTYNKAEEDYKNGARAKTSDDLNAYVDAVAGMSEAEDDIAPEIARADETLRQGDETSAAIRDNGADGMAAVAQARAEAQNAQDAAVVEQVIEDANAEQEQNAQAEQPVQEEQRRVPGRIVNGTFDFGESEDSMREANIKDGRTELNAEERAGVEEFAKRFGTVGIEWEAMPVGFGGYFSNDGKIHLNVFQKGTNGASYVEVAKIKFVHELTHSLENTRKYGELQNIVKRAICNRYNIAEQNYEQDYVVPRFLNGYAREGVRLTLSEARREAIAHFMETNALGNDKTVKDFANFVARENSGLAGHIFNSISSLLSRAGQGDTAGHKLLYNSQKTWAKALKENKVDMRNSVQFAVDDSSVDSHKVALTEDEIRVNNEIAERYKNDIDNWDLKDNGGYFTVCNPNEILLSIGVPNYPIYFDKSKARKALTTHSDSINTMVLKNIPEMLNNPIAIVEGKDKTAIIYSETFINNTPIAVLIRCQATGRGIDIEVNKVRSIHPRRNQNGGLFQNEQDIVYLNDDKKRTDSWFQALGLHTPFGGTKYGSIRMLSFADKFVNPSFSIDLDDTFSTRDLDELGMYYKSIRTVENDSQKKYGVDSLEKWLLGKGVKADEIKWLGINDLIEDLKSKGVKSIPRQELIDYINANKLNIIKDARGGQVDAEEMWERYYDTRLEALDYLVDYKFSHPTDANYDLDDLGRLEVDEETGEILGVEEFWDDVDVRPEYIADLLREIADNTHSPGERGDALRLANEIESDSLHALMEGDLSSETSFSRYAEDFDDDQASYREILYEVPKIEEADGQPWLYTPHWGGTKNVVAHARTQDTRTADGTPVRFIDEFQSDLHQQGRDKGYKKPITAESKAKFEADQAEYARLLAIQEAREADAKKADDAVADQLGRASDNTTQAYWDKTYALMLQSDIAGKAYREAVEAVEAFKYDHPEYAFSRFTANMRLREESSIPQAPFEKTWHEFLVNASLVDAIKDGKDYLAWTTGEMQGRRYGMTVAKNIDTLYYDSQNRLLIGYKDGVRTFDENVSESDLPNYVGGSLAKELTSTPSHDWRAEAVGDGKYIVVNGEGKHLSGTFSQEDAEAHALVYNDEEYPAHLVNISEDFQIGAQGMHNFYDIGGKSKQNIPAYLAKIGKRWGVAPGMITLENGSVVPAIRITDEMKQTIPEQGFPMFALDIDDQWESLGNQYGTYANRNGRMRDANTPTQRSETLKTSKFFDNYLQNAKLSPDLIEESRKAFVMDDVGTYKGVHMDDLVKEAQSEIAGEGYKVAVDKMLTALDYSRLTPKLSVKGQQLLADAIAQNDTENVIKLAAKLSLVSAEAGALLNTFKVLRTLGGIGHAQYITMLVDRLNEKTYAKRIQEGKQKKLYLDQGLFDDLVAARDDKAVSNALNAIFYDLGQQINPTLGDAIRAWRYTAMLLNPVTWSRNMSGNGMMYGVGKVSDSIAAKLEERFVPKDQRTHAIFNRNSEEYAPVMAAARESWLTNKDYVQGSGKLSFENQVKRYARTSHIDVLNTVEKFSGDALEWQDGKALRRAYVDAYSQYLVAQEIKDPSKMTKAQVANAVDYATTEAQKKTFRDPSWIAAWLSQTAHTMSEKGWFADMMFQGVMPFVKTPVNILRRGIEYSPIGLMQGTFDALVNVKKGKVTAGQAVNEISSGITGSFLFGLGMLLSRLGALRAHGEDDDKYEQFLEQTGEQEYSLHLTLGDKEVSIALSQLAPSAIPLFMGASLAEGVDSDTGLSVLTMLSNAVNPMMEMSFLSSLNQALTSYNGYGQDDTGLAAIGAVATSVAKSYASQFLPTIGAKIANVIDDTKRTSKGFKNSTLGDAGWDSYVRGLERKVPGLENTLEESVDALGRTTKKWTNFSEWLLTFANNFVFPTNVNVIKRNEVDREIIDVFEMTGNPECLPVVPSKFLTKTIDGEEQRHDFTAEEYTQYSKQYGNAVYSAIKDTMETNQYLNANWDERALLLEKAIENAEKTIRDMWKEDVFNGSDGVATNRTPTLVFDTATGTTTLE